MIQADYAISTEVLSLPLTAVTLNGFEYSPDDEIWVIPDISHTRYFNFRLLAPSCTSELIHNLKLNLIFTLREKSASNAHNMFCQFKNLVRKVSNGQQLSEITVPHILSYKGNLPQFKEWHLGSLSGFLKKWHELGYSGIDKNVYSLLNELRLKGAVKGTDVLTFDPKRGPFNETELHSIHKAIEIAYAEGRVSNRAFSLVWLFIATGARPVQIAQLKIKDLIIRQENGKKSYFINIPRAKQRTTPRSSFKLRPLLPEVGEVLEAWIVQVKRIYARRKHDNFPELPIFPISPLLTVNPLPGFIFHCEATELNREIQQVFSTMDITTCRTGEQMKITPKRFRHTLGTRAAMEGKGALVIAELLDHSDTQNVQVYVKSVPEIFDKLDEALSAELAPFANAFAGKIIEDDTKAIRSDDPASLVRFPKINPRNGGVGRCGGYGECNGMVPVACYVCKNFQAWLNAPHEEVLKELVEERQRILEETGDKRIAFANNYVIQAVSQLVQMCSEIREAVNG